MRFSVALAAALGCALLTACGGGGGGGGNNGGGPPVTSISLDKNRLDLSYEQPFGNGNAQEVTVTFKGSGVAVGTRPGETLPSWVFVSSPTVVNATTVTVRVTFNPPVYEPQRWSTTLRFATADANGNNIVYRDLTVTGTIDHELSPNRAVLTYTREATASPSITAALRTLNATWEATSSASWLQVSPASGTGATTLDLTTTPTALVEGDYSGTITVRDTLTNHTKQITVLLGVDPRRLEVSRRGLAFTSTLGGARLQRTVRVIDTAALAGHWTASSDAPWLVPSITQGSGTATLTLSADPTGLAEGMHYATLTIAPDQEPGLNNSPTVRCGFYVDRTNVIASPAPFSSGLGYTLSTVMDPIRPYFYSVNVDPPNASVRVWNVYTGALVDTVPVPAGYPNTVGISGDGSRLLIADGSSRIITPISLEGDTRIAGTTWTGVKASAGIENLAITRINGSDVVAWGPGQLLSLADGQVLVNFETSLFISADTPRFIATAPDGRAAYIAGQTVGNHRLQRYALGYRAGTYSAVLTTDMNEPGEGSRPAVDPSGRYLYSGGDRVTRYDALTMETQLSSSAIGGGEMDLLEDGSVYVAINHGPYVHLNADLIEVARQSYGISFFYTGRISSDERRLFAISDSDAQFVDLTW